MVSLLETIMDIIESLHPTPKAWLLNSALAPHLEWYCAHFRLGRYATTYSVGCVAGLAHFARWMTQCGLAVEQLDEHKVEQFLDEHLPCCDCPKPVRRNHGALRAALGHMLVVLLEHGVIHAPAAATGEIADELRRYDEHMNKSRGLSEGTRRSAIYTVRQLLLHVFAGRPVVIAGFKPDDVRKFIAERLNKVGTTSNAIMLASVLRAYFRYRATCGDEVYGLLGVISSPAHWNLASLPRALKPDEVSDICGELFHVSPLIFAIGGIFSGESDFELNLCDSRSIDDISVNPTLSLDQYFLAVA